MAIAADSTTAPAAHPAYAAPAARGATAYYADKAGKRFLMTAFAGHGRRVGEPLDLHGKTYIVEGAADGVSGLTWRSLGQEVEIVDGLPVARYLPVVSKPSLAQLAAQMQAAA